MDEIINKLLTPEGIGGIVTTIFVIRKEIAKHTHKKSKLAIMNDRLAAVEKENAALKEKYENISGS